MSYAPVDFPIRIPALIEDFKLPCLMVPWGSWKIWKWIVILALSFLGFE